MGGFGSGGRRVNAGRKSKGARILDLHGGRDRKPKRASAAAATLLESVDPPKHLRKDELVVWRELAPHALRAQTLTAGDAGSLAELCVAIIERDRMREAINEDGWTFKKAILSDEGETLSVEIKKHPLIPEYRQWMIRVEAGRARFKLAPSGKEIVPDVKEEDPFAEFDAAGKL